LYGNFLAAEVVLFGKSGRNEVVAENKPKIIVKITLNFLTVG
jgi:hypothetical protein